MSTTKYSCLIKITFISLLLAPGIASAGEMDWMNNSETSCKATIKGKLSGTFSKHGFWFDTAVSMDTWAQNTLADRPEDTCYIRHQGNQNQGKLLHCLAYIKNNWDWYNRCKPIVDFMSKKEGR